MTIQKSTDWWPKSFELLMKRRNPISNLVKCYPNSANILLEIRSVPKWFLNCVIWTAYPVLDLQKKRYQNFKLPERLVRKWVWNWSAQYEIPPNTRMANESSQVILYPWKLRDFIYIMLFSEYSADNCGRTVEIRELCWAAC